MTERTSRLDAGGVSSLRRQEVADDGDDQRRALGGVGREDARRQHRAGLIVEGDGLRHVADARIELRHEIGDAAGDFIDNPAPFLLLAAKCETQARAITIEIWDLRRMP